MYSLYYDFNVHENIFIEISLFLLPAIIFISIIALCKIYNKPIDPPLLIIMVIAPIAFLSISLSLYDDYTWYSSVYNSSKYIIIEGKLHTSESDPNNYNTFYVNNIEFKNIPREINTTFDEYNDFFTFVKEGREARIWYTTNRWDASRRSILHIDLKDN
jgi:hypothetical protein